MARLDAMMLKHRQATTSEAVESTVILNQSVRPNSPVSPNVRLNLVLGTMSGFLLSPLVALSFIAVLKRMKG